MKPQHIESNNFVKAANDQLDVQIDTTESSVQYIVNPKATSEDFKVKDSSKDGINIIVNKDTSNSTSYRTSNLIFKDYPIEQSAVYISNVDGGTVQIRFRLTATSEYSASKNVSFQMNNVQFVDEEICDHDWSRMEIIDNETYYICSKCGARELQPSGETPEHDHSKVTGTISYKHEEDYNGTCYVITKKCPQCDWIEEETSKHNWNIIDEDDENLYVSCTDCGTEWVGPKEPLAGDGKKPINPESNAFNDMLSEYCIKLVKYSIKGRYAVEVNISPIIDTPDLVLLDSTISGINFWVRATDTEISEWHISNLLYKNYNVEYRYYLNNDPGYQGVSIELRLAPTEEYLESETYTWIIGIRNGLEECKHEKTEIKGNSIYCVECGTKLRDVPNEDQRRDMMYRIALQLTPASPNKPATFQYLTGTGVEPWGVENLDEALDKYNKELDNYKRSVITLVHIVDIECELKADPCCTEPVTPEEPTPEVVACSTCGATEGVTKVDETKINCPTCGEVEITA